MNRVPASPRPSAAVLLLLLLLAGGCVHPARSPRQGAGDGLTPVTLRTVAGLPPLVIVAGGVAQTAIIPAPGRPYYREVAEFLADYLQRATRAKFVITNAPLEQGDAIYVGPVETPGTAKILARARALPAEHFIVERFAGGVILVGNDTDRAIDRGQELSIYNLRYDAGMLWSSRGTLFAAIDVLERFVGLRWYLPGPLGLCVPDLTAQGLTLPAVAYTDGPVFAHRFPSGASDLPDETVAGPNEPHRQSWWFWSTTLSRMGTRRPAIPNHTDGHWHEFYAQSHPEYFALRADGTRMIGGAGRELYSAQRCYTDPGGFQQHLRNLERYLATGAGAETFTLRLECLPNDNFIYWLPNDGFTGCECPACRALTDQAAPTDRIHSRLIWSYAAQLGRAIKQKWPHKKLCVLAYATFAVVPPDLDLPDNIVATLCLQDVSDAYMKEPLYRQANQARVDALYRKLRNKVGLWIYYPASPHSENKMSLPLFAPHVTAEFLRANRDKVFGAILDNLTQESLSVNGPALYLYHKQLWNPDLDVDAFLTDYITRMYGPAVAAMRRYYDTTIARWENTRWSYLPPPYRLSQAVPESLIWQETYPRPVREELQRTLAAALAAAPAGSLYQQRVQYLITATTRFFEAGKFADEMVKPVLNATRLNSPLTVDGDLADWPVVQPVTLMSWMGEPAREKTEIRTAYDDETLYIAGRVAESAGAVLAADPRPNSLWQQDSIELYLCADQVGFAEAGIAKTEQFHQIVLNARNQVEVYRRSPGTLQAAPVTNFNFTHAVQPWGRGFQFEIALPYRSLTAKSPVAGKTEWSANFYRNRPRGADQGYQAWSPTMGKGFSDTQSFGALRFPGVPLCQFDFKKTPLSIQQADGLAASSQVREGNLVVTLKAPTELPANAQPYVDLSGIPALVLPKPVVIEMVFRYRGQGVAGVWLNVKDSAAARHRNVATYHYQPVHAPDQMVESDWMVGRIHVPRADAPLRDLTYWDISAAVAPGADFTFEVASLKVFPAQ